MTDVFAKTGDYREPGEPVGFPLVALSRIKDINGPQKDDFPVSTICDTGIHRRESSIYSRGSGPLSAAVGTTGGSDDLRASGDGDGDGGDDPTDEELQTLRRVPDTIPFTIYSIALVELLERFSFYGTMGVVTNYIQWPLPQGSATGAAPHGQPGAMGLGQQVSTGVTLFNCFWQYTTPLLGAYIADTFLGRFTTISVALGVEILGQVVLLVAGLPPVITHRAGAMTAFMTAMLLLGLANGGIKPNVNPLIAEQLPSDRKRVVTLPRTGERVIVDPSVTVSRVYHYFYMFINIGALLGQLAMVYTEKYVGFYVAFLLPITLLVCLPLVLCWGRTRYHRTPPTGSVLGKALQLFRYANAGRWSLNPVATYRRLNDGTFWEAVKPSAHAVDERPAWMTFDDAWVAEVRRGFHACSVFLWSPLFWICYNQMFNNLVSQAAIMQLGGVPNDFVSNINPLTLIFAIPVMDTVIYPCLRRLRVPLTPIKKITAGYGVSCVAMVWAAVVQYYIYERSECGQFASGSLASGERCRNVGFSVWWQAGTFMLIGFAEILTAITSLEYAYSKAPRNMRSIVQAFGMFMNAISAALGFSLVPLSEDPFLVWNYIAVAILTAVGGALFWCNFRALDAEEDSLNMLPSGTFGEQDQEK